MESLEENQDKSGKPHQMWYQKKVGRKQLRFPPTRLYMYYFHIDFIVRTRPVAGLPLMVMLLYILLGYTSKVCAMDPLPVNNSTDDWSI